MNTDDVDRFEKIFGQLTGIYDEMSLLSKKSPTDAVNKFKLKFVNQQITECSTMLSTKYRPFDDFDQFSEDDVPQNSDVVFIVAQYLQCMEKLRADNVVQRSGTWFWRVKGKKGEPVDEKGFALVRTTRPKHLRE
ncbi:hypothetical protein [Comamonas sp. 23]|uniref:hypothetical protein n=1 Tax=Comamonas sp. 23 TaxID=3415008 RepID=UPI003C6FDF76